MKRRCAQQQPQGAARYRDFLLEQQNVLKKIEADVEIMGDRMEALADEIERLNGSVAEASANFEAHRPRIWRRRRSRSPRSRS